MKKIMAFMLALSMLAPGIPTAFAASAANADGGAVIEVEDFIEDNNKDVFKKIDEVGKASGDWYIRLPKITASEPQNYTMKVTVSEAGDYTLWAGAAVFYEDYRYLSAASFTINGTDTRYFASSDSTVVDFTTDKAVYGSFYANNLKMMNFSSIKPVRLNEGENTVVFTVYDRKYNSWGGTNYGHSSMFIAGLDYIKFEKYGVMSVDNNAIIEAEAFREDNSKTPFKYIDEINKASGDYYMRLENNNNATAPIVYTMTVYASEEGDYTLWSGLSAFCDGYNYLSPVSFTINGTDTRWVRSSDSNTVDFSTDGVVYGSFYVNQYKMLNFKSNDTVHLVKGANTIDFTVYDRKDNSWQGTNYGHGSLYTAAIDYIKFVNILYPEEPDDPDAGRPDVKLMCDENGDFTILCVSDPQWNDMQQCIVAKNDLETIVERVNPDYVMIEGDMTTSGEIETDEWETFISPLTERHIKWSTVNGNHDIFRNSHYKMFVGYEDCLNHLVDKDDPNYEIEKPMNYVIPIYANNGEDMVFAVWGMDTGKQLAYGFDGCSEKQIAWYRAKSDELKAANGGNPVTGVFCGHIPFSEVITMYKESKGNFYGLCGNNDVDGTKERYNYGMLQAIKEQGDIKLAVFGHDHLNNFIGMTDGLLTGYTGKLGSGDQNDIYAKGGRVIRFNQANPEKFTTAWYGIMHTSIDQPALYSDGTRADK